MRIYDLLSKHIKKILYIVYNERFKSETSDIRIERFLAKHFLLKPELIVVNDQLHGFKKTKDSLLGLEKFPIFLEIEYLQTEDGQKFLENIDLYAESEISSSDKTEQLARLFSHYKEHVVIEKVVQLSVPPIESMIIYSRLNEFLSDQYLEEDLQDGMTSGAEVEDIISQYLVSFANFLKHLDGIVHHKKTADNLPKLSKTLIQD